MSLICTSVRFAQKACEFFIKNLTYGKRVLEKSQLLCLATLSYLADSGCLKGQYLALFDSSKLKLLDEDNVNHVECYSSNVLKSFYKIFSVLIYKRS